jgi:hypothetical protein
MRMAKAAMMTTKMMVKLEFIYRSLWIAGGLLSTIRVDKGLAGILD